MTPTTKESGGSGGDLDVDELCLDQIRHEVEEEGTSEPEPLGECGYSERIFSVLFNEEAGALLQVRAPTRRW